MSKGKIKRAASTLRALEGITFESCLDEGNHCYEINKWLIEVAMEVANKGLFQFAKHFILIVVCINVKLVSI